MKKILSLLLVVTLVFGVVSSSFGVESYNYTVKINNDTVYTIKTLDGRTLTQEEFMEHLEKHSDQIVRLDSVESQEELTGASTYSVAGAGALIAGTWYIPIIGKVVITTAGIMIIGGAVISAGSWLYNQVVDWFEARAVKADYEEAKDDGKKTDNHEVVEGERSLPARGQDPYSSKDLKDSDGDIKQRRYYGEDGNAEMDIDYKHEDGDNSHTFPHRHDWDWSKNPPRGDAY